MADTAVIDAGRPWLIAIGDESILGPRVTVLCHDASMRLHTGYTRIARVSIGRRVFVGTGAVILPGSWLGDDVIVGANSVVRGNIPASSVIAGNPARIVGETSVFVQRHVRAAEEGLSWPAEGWTRGRGITRQRKLHQTRALAATDGYVEARRSTDAAPWDGPAPTDG